MSPLHGLTKITHGGMTIAKLTLADKGAAAEFTVAFRPRAFTVLLNTETRIRKCRYMKGRF